LGGCCGSPFVDGAAAVVAEAEAPTKPDKVEGDMLVAAAAKAAEAGRCSRSMNRSSLNSPPGHRWRRRRAHDAAQRGRVRRSALGEAAVWRRTCAALGGKEAARGGRFTQT
jgi:hypothetical protein